MLLGAGLLVTMAQGGWAATPSAATAAGTATGATVPTRGYTVTLLTGDRVSVASATATSGAVRPAKGREQVRFLTMRDHGDLYVVPQDALTLLRDRKVDKRLFDVSALIRFGYDDAHRDSIPLIVSYQQGIAHPNAAVTGAGARVTRGLPDVNGSALVAPKSKAAFAWSALTTGNTIVRSNTAAGIAHVWLDGKRPLALDQSVPQIGAPAAWKAGFTGKGVSVAVLDTGIDATHPDLAGKVLDAQNFSEAPDATDTVGHGTHVASIIAGTGAASGGKYRGVAPDATLLSGKVCEDFGCTDSAILAGMQWAAADKHAKVANLSLGGTDTPDIDPLEQAVNTLTAQYGTLFVVAAGNDGPADTTVGSPGSADAALTVGAVDKSDNLAFFSSRGPRVGDNAMKPDITAPGVDIVAARATGTQLGDLVGDKYVRLSGTSMATPHVTGSVAILAQQHPSWTPQQYKDTLMASAKPNPAVTGFQQGAGRVDVARAIGQTVTTSPASLSYGLQMWPHTDDKPIVKTLTYRNGGTDAVTLSLALKVLGPAGTTVPAGLFTLSATQLTVPAGGQATVDVTTDTRVGGADGLYSGELLATGGGVQVSTALGVNKEVESYNLTIHYTDRAGAATGDAASILTNLGDMTAYMLGDPSGTVKVRLPKGTYDVGTFMFPLTGADPKQRDQIFMAQPVLTLVKDTTVEMDARTAKPVNVTVPKGEAQPALVMAQYLHSTPAGLFGVGLLSDSFAGMYTEHQGPAVPAGQKVVGEIDSQWARPNPAGGFDNSGYEYATTQVTNGLPTGFVKRYRPGDFATVQADQAAVESGYVAMVVTMPFTEAGGWGAVLLEPLPSTFTRYVTTEGGQSWISDLGYGTLTPDGFVDMRVSFEGVASYRAGQHVRDLWDRGPFGPAFPPTPLGGYIVRNADLLVVSPSLFTDVAGHAGWSVYDEGSVKLYRDGTLIGQSTGPGGVFTVPAAAGTYRAEVTVTRTGFAGLSSSETASWTFRSTHVSGTDFVPVPALAVRFTPKLNAANLAPAGRYEIPISVQAQAGTPVKGVRLGKVDVSYDDGATWRPAPLRQVRGGWVALVTQPATGYVSLRATATDVAGDRVDETVIHAYGLTAR